MLEAALAYLRRGWSVVPLAPGTKDQPLVKWGQFQERLPTEAEVTEWWTRWPDANIALVTGPLSDVAVLDLELQGLEQITITSNTVSLTGRGQHGFFKYPESLRNKAAIDSIKGFDIRGAGGYAVLPPSLHSNGKRYTWLLGPANELPEFPIHVIPTEQSLSTAPRDPNWVGTALSGLSEGNRNDTFARVVGKLHRSGLDKTAIWSLLLPHARAVHFSEKELNGVIQSISRYPTDRSGVSDDSQSASIECFLSDPTPVLWVCEPIIAHGTLGFVAGLPETMKTWITIDLAVECAKGGGLWLGLFPVSNARVLFIDQERFRGETQRRFLGVMAAKGLEPNMLKDRLFIKSGTTTRLDLDDSYRAFRQQLMEIRPDLVIVDSFATFHVGDENDRMTIQRTLERIKELRAEVGCAFIFIDHENKGAYSANENNETPTAGRMSGSVGKVAAAEFVLTVRRYDPATCMVYHTKSTLGPRVPSFTTHVSDLATGGIRVFGEGGKA